MEEETFEVGEFMRTGEVAKLLHVSPKTVSRWAAEDKIPCVKTIGGHRRFPAKQIRELVASLSDEHSDYERLGATGQS